MKSVLHKSVLTVPRVVSEEKTYRSSDRPMPVAVRKVPVNSVSLLPIPSVGGANSLGVVSNGFGISSEIRVRPSLSIVRSALESIGQKIDYKARSSTNSSVVKRPIGSAFISVTSLPLQSTSELSSRTIIGDNSDTSIIITNKVTTPCVSKLPSDLPLATSRPSSFIQFDSDGDEDWWSISNYRSCRSSHY